VIDDPPTLDENSTNIETEECYDNIRRDRDEVNCFDTGAQFFAKCCEGEI
jgi:hypothetical protein